MHSYKFENVYAAYRALADLLDARLLILPAEEVLVPLPTTASYFRRRGYDHMKLVAQELATKRHLSMESILERAENSVQTGSS